MKLFKSKSGFTLIELLVVIGILAVLAAIAIPSVAGLIDRANVSADKTNANEMTNAIERFAAEYELYCQDIASGVIDANTTDFDAAQGRVLNVTGIRTRGDVTAFESETGLGGKGINRDTKYPVNEATLKAIVENYTKTSSATFTPKQSDHEFYYSPEIGIVIAGEQGATIAQLNDIAFASAEDVAQFDTITWICLDEEVDNVATETENVFGELQNGVQQKVIKTMTINGTEYRYEDGMDWGAWVVSEYNTTELVQQDGGGYMVTTYPGVTTIKLRLLYDVDIWTPYNGEYFLVYSVPVSASEKIYEIEYNLTNPRGGLYEEEIFSSTPTPHSNGKYYLLPNGHGDHVKEVDQY